MAIGLLGPRIPLSRRLPLGMTGFRFELVGAARIPPIGLGVRVRPVVTRGPAPGCSREPIRRRAFGFPIVRRIALARPRTFTAGGNEGLVLADQSRQLRERIILRACGAGRAIPRIGIETWGTVPGIVGHLVLPALAVLG